ncbi:MAG: phosphoribosylformylglycinamidine cyclo-ligase, partial [Clostridia bacterium]|nr:phosphoribosylformylglycinamidine cyclo-ligase [Clostridia bacterium]
PVLKLLESTEVHGISHITGGGFYENLPRCIPDGLGAVIEKNAVSVPPVFRLIAEKGKIPERDMFNTFNMGVGMCAVVGRDEAGAAVTVLNESGVKAYAIGEIVSSGEKIRIV